MIGRIASARGRRAVPEFAAFAVCLLAVSPAVPLDALTGPAARKA
jgi:hypothetical protein